MGQWEEQVEREKPDSSVGKKVVTHSDPLGRSSSDCVGTENELSEFVIIVH